MAKILPGAIAMLNYPSKHAIALFGSGLLKLL
jgi:hypothetical protein